MRVHEHYSVASFVMGDGEICRYWIWLKIRKSHECDFTVYMRNHAKAILMIASEVANLDPSMQTEYKGFEPGLHCITFSCVKDRSVSSTRETSAGLTFCTPRTRCTHKYVA